MKSILSIAIALLCFIPVTVRADSPPPNDVSPLLTPIVQKHDVPGMAVAVIQSGETVAVGVAGVRTRGKDDKIAAADHFHIGSVTKGMTAMLCGILVDEGKMKWSQTLGETFPELKESIHPQYQAVTLEQFLTHRGGAPGALEKDGLWGELWQFKGTPTNARRRLLTGVTRKPPEAPPGTKFIYSNAGVSIAGHMAEKVTGESWEDLVREKVFRPLGMTTAGFGPPGTRIKNDQPRGHKPDGSPVEPGPAADNPVAIGPAGIVHCSIGDLAKYVAANLRSGKTQLVKPETLERLHTPASAAPGDPKYAMGWFISDGQPWAGGSALTHIGSNTMWFAVVWLAPEKDFAVVIACNQADGKSCNDAALALIADHFKGDNR
ncbi:Beta-lactamase [Roseimaritima multifibrata]|uniref:Beta-lactamase n=1 Tax=Roseimaritima multifibrata TaxID=1930274 RepID=A0A517MP19_9BACT|nr:serine hydrolase domain-containing protein [Roseimaritima multifibrata]QDS96631.1 Beta-lactamase [Roseimaritima multifibrata]